MSLYVNALVHCFKSVFKALGEIFFFKPFDLFLDKSINLIRAFGIFCSLIFVNRAQFSDGEYVGSTHQLNTLTF